ncbi:hypothetical protein LWI28_010924 [Acer negundo]|uniref:Uncharacterized protein n=1 Tax=Acer negundo TaxID=4023 RepID=A0AAD5IPR5_ACENE|nr:hypothetical protein LWI28_010924 [Acer negundo]
MGVDGGVHGSTNGEFPSLGSLAAADGLSHPLLLLNRWKGSSPSTEREGLVLQDIFDYYPDSKLGGAIMAGEGSTPLVAGLSITDMGLTIRSRSVPRYGSISLRSVYESAASLISGVGSPTNYCAATRTGTASI